MEPLLLKRRRVSGWKVFGVILGVILLLVLTTVWWISSVAERRWADMERQARALLEEARSRDSSRPVLRGEPIDGNAWDDYAVALKPKLGNALGEYVSRGPKADRSAVEAVFAANPTVLDTMRKGARRTHAQFPIEWDRGANLLTAPLGAAQNLANLTACQARFLVEAGRHREAAELLLDGCQFAHVLGNNSLLIGEMIALANYSILLWELPDLLEAGKLTVEELRQIARELEVIDRHFPTVGVAMSNELAYMGFNMLEAEGQSTGEHAALAGVAWRYGFSARLMLASAYFEYAQSVKRLRKLDDKPWPEVKAGLDEIMKEIQSSRNPMTRSFAVGSAPIIAERERRAQLRLLRVAAHGLATGEILDLEDPFGSRIRSEGKSKFWSVGPDGVDDGGKGEFKRSKTGPDIVLELKR